MTDNEMEDADERAQLQDEIVRLTGELAQVRKILGDREDDIMRLTAALREVIGKGFVNSNPMWAVNIARAALERK